MSDANSKIGFYFWVQKFWFILIGVWNCSFECVFLGTWNWQKITWWNRGQLIVLGSQDEEVLQKFIVPTWSFWLCLQHHHEMCICFFEWNVSVTIGQVTNESGILWSVNFLSSTIIRLKFHSVQYFSLLAKVQTLPCHCAHVSMLILAFSSKHRCA